MNRALLVIFAPAVVAGTLSVQFGIAVPLLLLVTLIAPCIPRLPRTVRACTLTALALGMLAGIHTRVHTTNFPMRDIDVRGTIVEISVSDQTHSSFTLRSDEGFMLEVHANAEAPPLTARVLIRGRLEAFDTPRNPGEPSPHALAADRGLDALLLHARVRSVESPNVFDPHIWLPFARAWASHQIRARMDEPYASILAGALWGERGALPPELREEFQDTGTVHVLVTAGLHLGVIAALSTGLLTSLGAGRIGSSLASIALIWLYAAFSGAHLPSLRAATMASFALLARATGREALSWNALAAAAIVVSLGWPQEVASISFALSFSCVASIILLAPHITRMLECARMPHVLGEAIALTLATQIGTWPLTATAFLVFAPYAPLANALVVPTIGIAMLLGIAQLTVTPIPFLAQALANINTSVLMWIVGVVRLTASFPGAHIIMTPPPVWTIVVYDVALLFIAFFLARDQTKRAAILFFCACVPVICPPRFSRHELIVVAIDVGQADALLVETPHGHTFLIDAGGRLERGTQTNGASEAQAVGERIVVPFLIRRGIHHLDGILLSHPHGDHAGGAAPVLRTLGAKMFADSGQSYPGHAYQAALDAARERHVPFLEPRGGDLWSTDDGVRFRFYGPTAPYLTGTRNDINNNSLVFRLEYERFSMLFTGDAGAEAEQCMLARGDDVRANVLKVGHHGSMYSSTPAFLRAVSPAIAVISVGRHNRFGHPAAQTLSALRAIGARVFRTDENGAVIISSDGTATNVEPFLQAEMQSHRQQTLAPQSMGGEPLL